jgi:hypothetical protein
MRPVDRNGIPLREGASVRLLRADPALLSGLPVEDQQAIEWARKEGFLQVTDLDVVTGNVELEFKDPGGTVHWIFVQPEDVAAVAA